MKHLLVIFLLSLVAFNAQSGTISSGPTDDGGRFYEIKGCDTITNITGNMNGYTITPEMTREDRIVICDDNKYTAPTTAGILKQIAKKAADLNCFDVNVDDQSKTAHFTYLPGDKVITHELVSIDTYSLEGHKPFVKERQRVRVRHLCVLSENGLEEPYINLLN